MDHAGTARARSGNSSHQFQRRHHPHFRRATHGSHWLARRDGIAALPPAERLPKSLVFTFDRTGPGALVVEDIPALHARLSRWVEANLHELEAVLPLERAFDAGEEPVQAMICGTLAVMSEGLAALDAPTEQAENLRKIISIHRTEYPARDLAIVDLMPNGCSKGSALARLAADRGVDAAEIVAIGDNMNDAEMLAYAGRAVVMENSPAELLQMAAANGWSVAGSNESDGAAQAILRMLNQAQPAIV